MEKEYRRHLRVWTAVQHLVLPFVRRRFNFTCEPCEVEGPCLIVSNHVSNWDPLLLAMSFPRHHFYFVASEHIFRGGLLSRLLRFFLAPIPRKKAAAAMGTVIQCMKQLNAGHSVCIFAEGNASWDGLSSPVAPAIGKLARSSGATLVTYRLDGVYLSCPRWGRGIRKGASRGSCIGVYTPEKLKKLSPGEITDLISRDIDADAWAYQKKTMTCFNSHRGAERLETALFLCPKCRHIGTLKSSGNEVGCFSCGFKTAYGVYGFFEPAEPFETVLDWDRWQIKALESGDFVPEKEQSCLFSDSDMQLVEIIGEHTEKVLARGTLLTDGIALFVENMVFPFEKIDSMDMVKTFRLLFTFENRYFEIRGPKTANLRKYLLLQNTLIKRG